MQDPSKSDPLAGYNPFVPETPKKTFASLEVSPQPQTPLPTSIVLGQLQQQSSISSDDFLRRQEELERKAADLERREEELRSRSNNFIRKENNWPPLPNKFCVEPCFYQDIDLEISVEFQQIVRMLYYMWMVHTAMYVMNIGGCLALFIEEGSGTMFGLSVLYCILFVPASYLFWFRPVYKAFKSDSSFNFMVFFVFFFSQFVATIIQAVGFPGLGTCGFIVALATIGGHETGGELAVGIIVMILACCFGLLAFGDFFFLVRVSRVYRSSGGSFSKARAEFASGVMNNEHVRNVAAEAVTSAVRAQMSSSSNNQRV